VAGGAVQSCYCGAGATDPKSNAWTGNQTDYICNN
jgi:hypothetical protein